jgi:hypothetical protein
LVQVNLPPFSLSLCFLCETITTTAITTTTTVEMALSLLSDFDYTMAKSMHDVLCMNEEVLKGAFEDMEILDFCGFKVEEWAKENPGARDFQSSDALDRTNREFAVRILKPHNTIKALSQHHHNTRTPRTPSTPEHNIIRAPLKHYDNTIITQVRAKAWYHLVGSRF